MTRRWSDPAGRRRTALAAALAAVVGISSALTLAGCGATPSDPAVAAGFRLYRAGGASFAYPAGWRLRRSRGVSASIVVQASGPATRPDLRPEVLFAVFPLRHRVRPAEVFDLHRQGDIGVFGYAPLGERAVAVAGAAGARAFEWGFAYPGAGVRARKLDLVVVAASGRVAYNLQATASAARVEALRLRAVIGSFRLR